MIVPYIEGFLWMFLAYVLGSIPTAIIVGKLFYRIDIRKYGSGNAGATNTFRVLGTRAGIPVLLIDILKGFFAVHLVHYYGGQFVSESQHIGFQLLLGLSALAGHVFPIFARFKGGKGIATLLGVVIAIHPPAALVAMAIFLIVFFITRYVSLGSILAALSFPLLLIFVFKETTPSLLFFSFFVAIAVILTHQKNIERLLRREEHKARLIIRRNAFGEESIDSEVLYEDEID